MRNPVGALLIASSALLLAACDLENDDDFEGSPAGQFVASFDPSNSVIPFPNNILFAPSDDNPVPDGTLNTPVKDASDLSDPRVALNALDGFSTIAPITTTFSQAIDDDPANLAASVRVFSATINPLTLKITSITGELSYADDFFASVASTDPNGTTLAIVPLRPLQHATAYVVGIEKTLRAADGQTAETDTIYDATRIRQSLVDGNGNSKFVAFTDEQAQQLEPLRDATVAQDDALNAFSPGLADAFAIAWAFKTQSIGVVLGGPNGVRALAAADPNITSAIAQATIGNTSTLTMGAAMGIADIYVGTLTLPYYLTAPSMANPTAPLTSVWKGPLANDVTGVIPGTTNVPAKTGDQVVSLWISIPNAMSPSGGVKPGGGWPVVIYQHGLTTNRATLLAIADALAAVGYAAVAIDLPLHGLAPDHTLRVAEEAALTAATIPLPTQRTFDVDYVTQDADGGITAQAPDGVIDSSGRHIVNIASLLTLRDNFRQGVADLFALHNELGNMDYDGGTQPDFDTGNVRFVGWSWGGIVGTVFLALEPNVGASVLAMPGGGFAKLADGSPNLGAELIPGLEAQAGIVKGTAEYESFLALTQTIVDSADPLNYAGRDLTTPGGNGGATLNGARGVMMFEVVGDGMNNLPDQTIPNNVGTFPTFADAPPGTVPSPTGGTDPLHREMGLNPVTGTALTAGAGVSGETQPLLRFSAGYHGSFADPSMDPMANADVTTVMQTAMGGHVFSNGTGFNVSTTNFAAVVSND